MGWQNIGGGIAPSAPPPVPTAIQNEPLHTDKSKNIETEFNDCKVLETPHTTQFLAYDDLRWPQRRRRRQDIMKCATLCDSVSHDSNNRRVS